MSFQLSEYLYERGVTKIFGPCFGRPQSVEGDKIRSVSKNKRCHKKYISHNFRNWARPLKSLLPLGYGRKWFSLFPFYFLIKHVLLGHPNVHIGPTQFKTGLALWARRLENEDIISQKKKITWTLVGVARLLFLQSWTDSSSILCLLTNSPSSCLGSTSAGCTAFGPWGPIFNFTVNWTKKKQFHRNKK